VCDPFVARSALLWRWDAEEGHRDPSRAFIYLVLVEFTAQTHWDAHSGVFVNWGFFLDYGGRKPPPLITLGY
jgi:hypothetical protein